MIGSLAEAQKFSVSAVGQVEVIPDMAMVSFSMTSDSYDPSTAVESLSKTIQGLVDDIRKTFKAEKGDIKTIQFYINPVYEEFENGPTQRQPDLLYYRVSHQFQALIRNIDNLGPFLGNLASISTDEVRVQIQSVEMQTSSRNDYEREALRNAIKSSTATAKVVADELGMVLGPVLDIALDGTFLHTSGPETARALALDVNIQTGTLTIQRSVTLAFRFTKA